MVKLIKEQNYPKTKNSLNPNILKFKIEVHH